MKKCFLAMSVGLLSLTIISSPGAEAIPLGNVNTTAYCSGTTTASGIPVRDGHIALSRDIIKQFGVRFGDKIKIEGYEKPFEYQDKMPNQWRCRMDIYMRDKYNARKYGVQKRTAWLIRQK